MGLFFTKIFRKKKLIMGAGRKKNLKGTWAMRNLGPKTKLQQTFAPKEFVPPKAPLNFSTKTIEVTP
jgi:hypothetical protein